MLVSYAMKKIPAFFTALAIVFLSGALAMAAAPDVSNVVIIPGRTERELNFAWQTRGDVAVKAVVQTALKSDMTSVDFPESKALTFYGKSEDFMDGLVSHKATVSRLAPSTSYIYRLGTGRAGEWSAIYEFSTRNRENYSVLLAGDIQIGAKNIEEDTAGWQDTLDKASQITPDAAFILSTGDQVDTASSQNQYDNMLSPPQFKNLPFVPTIGNHDNHELFSYHFNLPNESLTFGKTSAGGNYYFTYGKTLFLVINSNSPNYDQHEAFIRTAVKKSSRARWKIVMIHHSLYGADIQHSSLADLRKNFGSIFDKHGIDVVLSGHEHIYARAHFMLNDKIVQPLKEFPIGSKPPSEIPDGAVIKPPGTFYLMAGSSSGNKYSIPARQFYDFLAEMAAPYVPMFSRINITNTSFEIITYRTDNITVIDRFVMVKAAEERNQWNKTLVLLALCTVFAIIAIFFVFRFNQRQAQ